MLFISMLRYTIQQYFDLVPYSHAYVKLRLYIYRLNYVSTQTPYILDILAIDVPTFSYLIYIYVHIPHLLQEINSSDRIVGTAILSK